MADPTETIYAFPTLKIAAKNEFWIHDADAIEAELTFVAGGLLLTRSSADRSTTRCPRDTRKSHTTLFAQLRRGATTRFTEAATLTLYTALADQIAYVTARAHRVEATARLNADPIRAHLP